MHIKYKPAHAGSTAAGMGCCTEGMGLMGEKKTKQLNQSTVVPRMRERDASQRCSLQLEIK